MSRPDDKQKTGIIDYVLALILILIIALIFIQVFWRYVFNAAPSWTEEIAKYGIDAACVGLKEDGSIK